MVIQFVRTSEKSGNQRKNSHTSGRKMVSAVPLCLFAIAITVVSSQTPTPTDLESILEDQTPIADRRTFKHKKNVKFVPFLKKHKKFGGWLPHVFNKAEYAEVPIIHEPIVRPAWKVHRYQGIELKPIEVPEPYVETHAFEHDLPPPPPPPSNVLFYTDKPVFSPLAPLPPPTQFVFPSLPAALPAPAIFPAPLPPKTVLPFIPPPPPQAPVLQTIPFKVAPPQPAVFTVNIPQSPLPAVAPSPVPALPPPVTAVAPVKVPQPILPPISTPAPPPAFSTVTVAPPPAPVLPSLPVKIPQPILPPISTPAPPVFSSVTVAPPPSVPIFPSIPTNFQPPVIPSFPALPSLAAPLPFAAVPEPEFPYPPSDTSIPSYIKHDSSHDTPVIDTPIKIEHPEIEIEDHVKTPEHAVEIVKPDTGLLHKLKGWKAEKAQAALNHFSHFKAKPAIHHPFPISHPDKIPLPIPVTTIAPPHPTAFPTSFQFPAPIRPFPLAPAAPVYFPPTPQPISHLKYESFPPNNVELPPPPPPRPLFNSYGVPIPHDSYAPINRDSNDGLAPSASEEEPSVVPPPPAFGEQRNQPQQEQQQPQDIIQNFQPQSILSQKSPIFVPEEHQTVKEDVKTSQETQAMSSANSSVNSDSEDNYQTPQEENQGEETDPNLNNHRTY